MQLQKKAAAHHGTGAAVVAKRPSRAPLQLPSLKDSSSADQRSVEPGCFEAGVDENLSSKPPSN